jgi:anti-sigma B factor antagonist
MSLEFENRDHILITHFLIDKVEASIAEDTKDRLLKKIQEGYSKVILNLERVNFIDSSGLGVIISVLKNLGQDGQLVVCHVNEAIMSLFRLTRMNRFFTICSDTEEAVNILSMAN